VRTQTIWLRIHRTEHAPINFGRTGANRFDDPRREYGVLYAADTFDGAFIETFGRRPGVNVVESEQLDDRALAAIEALQPVRLVDLTGAGLAQVGATAYVTSGAHRCAQLWSRALWSHPGRPHGIRYRARHDPDCLCVALFERARPHVRATPQGGLLDSRLRPQLGATLRRYGFGLRDSTADDA
jgi:hypothetical protein